jgi:2-keto-4-pentenoate hydratase/2-oxohepta-3-ene-1,7-dioic acid hydratase in catechol pathway
MPKLEERVMKLCRLGNPNQEKPGVLLADGKQIDVSSFVHDYDEAFFASGGVQKLADWLRSNEKNCPVVDAGVRMGPCVARPSKIVCIGLNYAKHAAESGAAPPKEPVIFLKANSSITGPNDEVTIPKGSVKTDWEVELAVVIGKNASYVSEAEAMDYVAGYCLHNDYSEREYQLERGGTWDKGKNCATFAPIGPFVATRDEISDPHNLRLWLKVNGQMRQDSSTSDLIFKIPTLVSYVSHFMPLIPGDLITTGTPSGVGMGMKPPTYLKPGDVVELGVDGLGTSRQTLVAYNAAAAAAR